MLDTSLPTHEPVPGVTTVRADIFPAVTTFSFMENPYSRTRAIVTVDEVIVLAEAGGIRVLYQGRLEDYSGSRQKLNVVTDDGKITITKGGGCGCGARLKTYRPFGRVARMAVR